MGVISEFKEFALKGSVVDMAVGIILGAAFGSVVNSFVRDILSPPLGLLTGTEDVSQWFVALDGGEYATLADAQAASAPVITYGVFLTTIVSFLLVAWALFFIIRSVNRMRRRGETPPAPKNTRDCPYCVSTIALSATRCPNCTSELSSGETA